MRVLLTRPGDGGRRTAERLRALGHEVVAAPVLAIDRTAEPSPVGAFAAVVLTSANAAPFLPALPGGGSASPVFAVGERTAAAARAAGAGDVRVGEGDAAALARLVSRTLPSGSFLLLVAGRDRKAEPEASLRAAGFPVAVWTAYEAVAARTLPEAAAAALRAGRIDAALHYSRRSAAVLLALAETEGLLPALRALLHLCLSADVAEPLRMAGALRLIPAEEPSEDSLLQALAALGTAPATARSQSAGRGC